MYIYSRYFSCRTSNILLLISQQYYTYVYTCFLSGIHVGFTLLRADNPSKTQGLSTSIRWAVTLIAVIHYFVTQISKTNCRFMEKTTHNNSQVVDLTLSSNDPNLVPLGCPRK